MADKNAAYETIARLVDRFREHVDAYKRNHYNEHQTRVDYINPFFKALGWDMDNEQGLAEAYREVIHEDKIKIGGATKAPDYCFTVYGQRKFFLDAKKPAVNIKGDIHPAYQVRRYGWSAKVPVSIVTDFEEFSIYDCSKKPLPKDKASVARIDYFTFDTYLDNFDFFWDTFAKESILKGRFDKFVASDARKRGTATVDDAFLKSIEQWRIALAKNIALRNKALNQDELNYAVQKTIDRIIFLRMCEDRGVEQYGDLQKAAAGNIYENLFRLYRTADDKYNSGLFDLHEDRITPSLAIDNKVLKTIIGELYYPNCEYEFSVMPADILGSVYERFLGNTIRLTKGHQARVEQKPEVRKAGGVYYTPKYVVDYIVQNTVGKLVEGKTPKQVERLKVCDPACGSGSFLIGAYQFLLGWHLKYYTENPPAKKKNSPLTPDGNLSTAEKKRILRNNIFGVDIDAQAVEVTKLNLLLKALEGETRASISQQLSLFHERVLPNLNENIKCGNSLIGLDFYDDRLDLFPDRMKKINAFDWQAGFPEIFKQGGFDVVIGNPPYGMVGDNVDKSYFVSQYETTEGRFDRYELFIEKGVKLIKTNGMMSYIIPNPLLSNLYARKLREYLLQTYTLNQIVNFEFDVFDDPTIHTCIIILTNIKPKNKKVLVKKGVDCIADLDLDFDFGIEQSKLGNNDNRTFDIYFDPYIKRILDKMNQVGVSLGEVCYIRQCIKTGDDKIYVTTSPYSLEEPWKPTLKGRSIGRYVTLEKDIYLKYGNWLARNWKNKSFYETEKIVVRETGNRIISTLDTENRYLLSSLYSVYPKEANQAWNLKYLLAILNSNLATFFIKLIAYNLTKGAFTKVRTNQLARLPVKEIRSSNDKNTRDKIVQYVSQLLSLQAQLQATKLETQRQQIQRAIAHAEEKIDALVYQLYGLTAEEIDIIENA